MGSTTKSTTILCLILMLAGIPPLQAEWVENGIPVCTSTEHNQNIRIISDGADGAILVYQGDRSGNMDIYAQRVDASGDTLWIKDGIPVCTAAGWQQHPAIISDGAGNVIVTWDDNRDGGSHIYAQKIDASGACLWAENGDTVCTADWFQNSPDIAPDGTGGAIITWYSLRDLMGDYDIYAQRLDASGDDQWTTDGEAICTATGDQDFPRIVSDGVGGAIIAWMDPRSGNDDIYAQRIDASGNVQWTVDGVAVCSAAGAQDWVRIVSDGAGGAIIVWEDQRSGNGDIYAQRIDSNGTAQWTTDGIAICAAVGNQYYFEIISDGAGGAIIAWQDERVGGNADIYAQKINAGGTIQWTLDGVAICSAMGHQQCAALTSDGSGGAIITWDDQRDGVPHDVYYQRVDASGNTRWADDGVLICTVPARQLGPEIVSSGAGGAIIAWHDERNGNYDVYAQLIGPNGHWGYYPCPIISSVTDVPNDQGGRLHIQWDRSLLDTIPNTVITHYTVWRRLPQIFMNEMNEGAECTRRPYIPEKYEGPVPHFLSNGYSWEWLGNMPARYFESYTMTVESLYDSTGSDPGWQYFMVSAQTDTPYVYYDSPVDSGYSVDNFAPGQPIGLAGRQIYVPEGLRITWSPNPEPDLLHYMVYKGQTIDFVTGPGNLITSTADTTTFDGSWRWYDSDYYYKVSAMDVHGNESMHTLLEPSEISGEEGPEMPRATYLDQNYPNPFNPATTIRFGLEERSMVSLCIYDAAGRLIRDLVNEVRDVGRHEETWDGKDNTGHAAASGVYFYRLEAGVFTQTRKMVLLR